MTQYFFLKLSVAEVKVFQVVKQVPIIKAESSVLAQVSF